MTSEEVNTVSDGETLDSSVLEPLVDSSDDSSVSVVSPVSSVPEVSIVMENPPELSVVGGPDELPPPEVPPPEVPPPDDPPPDVPPPDVPPPDVPPPDELPPPELLGGSLSLVGGGGSVPLLDGGLVLDGGSPDDEPGPLLLDGGGGSPDELTGSLLLGGSIDELMVSEQQSTSPTSSQPDSG